MTQVQAVRVRGFSLVELLVVIFIIGLLMGILIPVLSNARDTGRQLKDSANIRSVIQGMQSWAQSHDEYYPLPSELDVDGNTVSASEQFHKDNSGNIFSLMVYNDLVKPEILISTDEENDDIVEDTAYEHELPQAAVQPARALWDPGFAGMPNETGSAGGGRRRSTNGNISFAHTPPFGKRVPTWLATFRPDEAVLANRGPLYGGVPGAWQLTPGPLGTESNTLRIHGGRGTWSGNIGFNDASVKYSKDPDPSNLVLKYPGESINDNVFANEDDLDMGVSAFLRESQPGDGVNAFLRLYGNVGGGFSEEASITVFND